MSNGTFGKGNITKIESVDLPSASEDSIGFLVSSEMEKLFRGTKPSTENPTTGGNNPTPIPQQLNQPIT